ncbi:MAG: phosphatidate cytidylyltransferase [Chitinophagaceae bacterium]|nr:MAG: phosphatidate cytidylyltransferase [Chitinophagaceae bacterium]
MGLNIATFRKRLLTAIIFVAMMLTGLLWNQWSFFILFSIVHFGCWFEYQRLVILIDPAYSETTGFHRYGVMLAGWCIMLYFTNDMFNIGDFSLHSMGWWMGLMFIFVLPLVELLFSKQQSGKNVGYSFFGLLYISLAWAFIIDLYDYYLPAPGMQKGPNIALTIILAVWINDTMAYLVGSFIGKTPFSKISPKKTWEGTLGGIVLCILIIGLVANSSFPYIIGIPANSGIASYHWFVIAGLVAIFGTAGDLFESKLKRMANVKDSGSIMPGHGGFLDRFDSLLFAVPAVWVYIRLFL